jgi:hypothetical protein
LNTVTPDAVSYAAGGNTSGSAKHPDAAMHMDSSWQIQDASAFDKFTLAYKRYQN